jgi:Glycosyl hydrolases family 2, TIM barrel domain/Glycosyl hydrolases family 2, sugar binding domain/Glycosyl hydrolases family 2
MRRLRLTLGGALAGAALLAATAAPAAALPPAFALSSGWQVRTEPANPAAPQQPPPEETAPDSGETGGATNTPPGPAPSQPGEWQPVGIPSVFDPRAMPALYPGLVKRYRLTFTGPPRDGFRRALVFEEVRRKATVYLNGHRLGSHRDPYVPFSFDARGLRPGQPNTLVVVVDNRKDPRLREGWWNWGGIVRPVQLVPVGRAQLEDLGWMSSVRCRGRARRCRASLLLDGWLRRRGRRRLNPTAVVRLRSPSGRVTRKAFRLGRHRGRRRHVRLRVRVPSPRLWSPRRPQLYSASLLLRNRGHVQQVENRRTGLRSVRVKRGRLYLNNRPIQLRGASIHEDMPGHGAALTDGDMNRIVSDLRELHANVTRAHYLLSERLLDKLDRAGIMVWSEAAIWQRDKGANLLHTRRQLRAAWRTVRQTVIGARSHPSVITHSVANELSFAPDFKRGTRRFEVRAARDARALDPTLPISIDINGRPGFPEQFTYHHFDMLGINEYFGWYPWVPDFSLLKPYLREMHELYPRQALVVTEFGAEARPELANAPAGQKGSYAFQAMHVGRTLDLVDRLRFLSGAIYWTLREFEIYPGWAGGVGGTAGRVNTRHNKGLLTYDGQKKPAWFVARDHFAHTRLYPRR